jgi:uncharacterized membrane protein
MGKKIALNLLYNIGIIVALFVVYEGVQTQHYSYILGAGFVAVMLIILKVRLMKQVRELSRNRKP